MAIQRGLRSPSPSPFPLHQQVSPTGINRASRFGRGRILSFWPDLLMRLQQGVGVHSKGCIPAAFLRRGAFKAIWLVESCRRSIPLAVVPPVSGRNDERTVEPNGATCGPVARREAGAYTASEVIPMVKVAVAEPSVITQDAQRDRSSEWSLHIGRPRGTHQPVVSTSAGSVEVVRVTVRSVHVNADADRPDA